MKSYTISISPAIKTDSGFIALPMSGTSTKIEAATFDEIIAERDKLVSEYKYSCSVSIWMNRVRGVRKTPGFDKWCDGLENLFNQDNVHPELADEIAA